MIETKILPAGLPANAASDFDQKRYSLGRKKAAQPAK